ncbi:MAG TPA: hypothetical protein VIU38_10155 [Anaerolineales bacterium]
MPNHSNRTRSNLFARDRPRARRLPLSILIIAALLVVFGLINPLHLPMTINPGSVSLPPPTSFPTALPRPTDIHGGHIVFTCTRKEINQICRIRADGSGYEQLTSGTANSYYPAIAPDGRHIVYAVNQYDEFDLYRLSPDILEGTRSSESRVKRLTDYIGNAFSPSYSPDGRQVVFVNRVAEGRPALWLMQSDGLDPHVLYTPPGGIVGAAWSPDGRKVAFTMALENSFSFDVYLLDLDAPDATPKRVSSQISDMGGSLSWSPDQNDLLIFAGPAAAREIYRLDIATGAVSQLTFGGNNASPAYSPDGRFIVFNSLRNGGQADLYVMQADGHSTRQLTDDPEPDWQPQWGP